MAARLEAEKFTGNNDYGLWKMKAILIQQELAAALTSAEADGKEKGPALDEKAHVIILYENLFHFWRFLGPKYTPWGYLYFRYLYDI